MTFWDYSSPGRDFISNQGPLPVKEQEQHKRFEGFNTAFDTQPHPPGEEPLNTPSLQSAGPIIRTFNNPIPTNPIINRTDRCMNRSR